MFQLKWFILCMVWLNLATSYVKMCMTHSHSKLLMIPSKISMQTMRSSKLLESSRPLTTPISISSNIMWPQFVPMDPLIVSAQWWQKINISRQSRSPGGIPVVIRPWSRCFQLINVLTNCQCLMFTSRWTICLRVIAYPMDLHSFISIVFVQGGVYECWLDTHRSTSRSEEDNDDQQNGNLGDPDHLDDDAAKEWPMWYKWEPLVGGQALANID